MTLAAEVVVLAHHPVLYAVPFFVPAFAIAGFVGHVVWRDRRDAASEGTADDREG